MQSNDQSPGKDRAIRRRVAWWTGIVAGAVLNYVFVYPVVAIFLFDRMNFFDFAPDWVADALDYSVIPLDWLHDSFEPYQEYIDWVDDLVT